MRYTAVVCGLLVLGAARADARLLLEEKHVDTDMETFTERKDSKRTAASLTNTLKDHSWNPGVLRRVKAVSAPGIDARLERESVDMKVLEQMLKLAADMEDLLTKKGEKISRPELVTFLQGAMADWQKAEPELSVYNVAEKVLMSASVAWDTIDLKGDDKEDYENGIETGVLDTINISDMLGRQLSDDEYDDMVEVSNNEYQNEEVMFSENMARVFYLQELRNAAKEDQALTKQQWIVVLGKALKRLIDSEDEIAVAEMGKRVYMVAGLTVERSGISFDLMKSNLATLKTVKYSDFVLTLLGSAKSL